MRLVETKSEEQQALLSLHRARNFVIRPATQVINMLRSLAAEFGVTIARDVTRAIDFAIGVIEGRQQELIEKRKGMCVWGAGDMITLRVVIAESEVAFRFWSRGFVSSVRRLCL